MLNFEFENYYNCPSCEGTGEFTIGDCEDGVYEVCPQCEGKGQVEEIL